MKFAHAGPLRPDAERFAQDDSCDELTICTTPSTSTADKHEIIQSKYWAQRQRFFSLWDHGVRMDHTAWYSVTPEALSRHHALRCTRAVPWEFTNPEKRNTLTILDACCGVGGNTIQFAAKGFNVIAFDNRIDTLELARCNSEIYQVANHVHFICGDIVQNLSRVRTDVIFLSPPWGGPSYLNQQHRLTDIQLSDLNGIQLVECALQLTPNVAYYLPRNIDLSDLLRLGTSFEVEKNYLNGKLKAITVYFGTLMQLNAL